MSMLLSRVAETAYWMARYVERAENTARIVMVNTNLTLDVPRSITLGWEPVLSITGSAAEFLERYKEASERSVIKFLVSDQKNPGSLITSIHQARENMRSARSCFPREAWETLNDLYLYARDQMNAGLTRRGRHAYLTAIVGRCQQLTGLLSGTMSHDELYHFLRLGRNLERADMTTRVLDVRAGNLLPDQSDELQPFEDIQWMSVLKSLAAYQMYRRHAQLRVRGSDVLHYLLRDTGFPRSVSHCLGEVENCLRRFPRNRSALLAVRKPQKVVSEINPVALVQSGLHGFLDELQIHLGTIHERLACTYFECEKAAG